MARRSQPGDPEKLRQELIDILSAFEEKLHSGDLRGRVLQLVPASHAIRDLGSSLIPAEGVHAARDRILLYLKQYPSTIIAGDELMVVAGIQDWPRRVRELRGQLGWFIVTGNTAAEMAKEDDFPSEQIDPSKMRPEDYALLSEEPDREAAHRWHLANSIRRERGSVQSRILKFLRANVGRPVTGEELRYVAKGATEWARRVRELRTEEGWPVVTKTNGRPDLPIGTYLPESERQSPAHDRHIPDAVRRNVLRRDGYRCRTCGWSHSDWNPDDPRHLEIHHVVSHRKRGPNVRENLITVCIVCHDRIHRNG